jgi:hypothetical protein
MWYCGTLEAKVTFQQLEDQAPALDQRWQAGMVLGLHGKSRFEILGVFFARDSSLNFFAAILVGSLIWQPSGSYFEWARSRWQMRFSSNPAASWQLW